MLLPFIPASAELGIARHSLAKWTAISKAVGPDKIYECCVPVCFLVYLTTIPLFKVVRPVAFDMEGHKYIIVTHKSLLFTHNHSHMFPLTSSHLQTVHIYIYNCV